jgi:hypothetical protein
MRGGKVGKNSFDVLQGLLRLHTGKTICELLLDKPYNIIYTQNTKTLKPILGDSMANQNEDTDKTLQELEEARDKVLYYLQALNI